MAISSTKTLLSLDRYCTIMGINPVHFNGGGSVSLISGKTLFPIENASNLVWPQFNWQNHDQVSRDELAVAISNAENEIKSYVGFSVSPDWEENVRYDMNHSFRPGYASYSSAVNLTTRKFISGGRKLSTKLGAYSVTLTDVDTDGWKEIATVTFPVGTDTDLFKYKIKFVGRDEEIRPAKTKQIIGANVVVTFNRWMLVSPLLWEAFETDDTAGKSIDMSVDANFVTTVDVYYETNDATKSHCDFNLFENGVTSIQGGYSLLSSGDNIISVSPGSYNSITGLWEYSCMDMSDAICMNLWYYAGARTQNLNKFFDYMPDQIATAISYLATARLERPFNSNTNTTSLSEELRTDVSEPLVGKFRLISMKLLESPFGTKRGEILAYNYLKNFSKKIMGSAVI